MVYRSKDAREDTNKSIHENNVTDSDILEFVISKIKLSALEGNSICNISFMTRYENEVIKTVHNLINLGYEVIQNRCNYHSIDLCIMW